MLISNFIAKCNYLPLKAFFLVFEVREILTWVLHYKYVSILLGVVACTCHPSYVGNINRRVVVQAGPSIKMWDPISKITKSKRTEDVAQMVQHLTCLAIMGPCVQIPVQSINQSVSQYPFHRIWYKMGCLFHVIDLRRKDTGCNWRT
jgi:hypothetical protein